VILVVFAPNDSVEAQKQAHEIHMMVKVFIIAEDCRLYPGLLSQVAVNDIPYWVWSMFNENSDWEVVRCTYRDMPTEIFYRFIKEHMSSGLNTTLRYVDDYADMLMQRKDEFAVPADIFKELFLN
jgi:hypothetical protein